MNVLLIIAVVVVLYGILSYNSLIRLKTRSEEGWSDIEVQMKRRYDLIPNLVETAKAYMKHEKETLEAVVKARNSAMNNQGTPEEQAADQNVLGHTLKSIFALSENYPDLKANQNFIELQRELTDTEDKIQAARRFYNSVVRDLNIGIDSFPKNLIASWFKFSKKQFFELDETEKSEAAKPVKVSF
ncbi:MAG: LemA family protein [Alphaproteobacteria bacterium]